MSRSNFVMLKQLATRRFFLVTASRIKVPTTRLLSTTRTLQLIIKPLESDNSSTRKQLFTWQRILFVSTASYLYMVFKAHFNSNQARDGVLQIEMSTEQDLIDTFEMIESQLRLGADAPDSLSSLGLYTTLLRLYQRCGMVEHAMHVVAIQLSHIVANPEHYAMKDVNPDGSRSFNQLLIGSLLSMILELQAADLPVLESVFMYCWSNEKKGLEDVSALLSKKYAVEPLTLYPSRSELPLNVYPLLLEAFITPKIKQRIDYTPPPPLFDASLESTATDRAKDFIAELKDGNQGKHVDLMISVGSELVDIYAASNQYPSAILLSEKILAYLAKPSPVTKKHINILGINLQAEVHSSHSYPTRKLFSSKLACNYYKKNDLVGAKKWAERTLVFCDTDPKMREELAEDVVRCTAMLVLAQVSLASGDLIGGRKQLQTVRGMSAGNDDLEMVFKAATTILDNIDESI